MSYHSNLTITSEDRERYRQHVVALDIPLNEVDAMIDIVHSIMSHFVDQAFHVQTDQITLNSIGKSFKASMAHATIEHHPDNPTADAPSDGVERDSNPLGPHDP